MIEFDGPPWLIVCEGPGDKGLLDRLLRHHSLDSNFQVKFPGKENGTGPGRGGIVKWLDLLQATSASFRANIKAVLIVADNDDSPVDSFDEIKKALRKAAEFKVTPPERAEVLVRTPRLADLVILMLPRHGRPGALESMCLKAAYSKWPIEEAVEMYVSTQTVPVGGWGLTKQDKSKMQIVIASTCEENPDTTLAHLWHRREGFHLPVEDDAFSEIVEFLRSFGRLLGQA